MNSICEAATPGETATQAAVLLSIDLFNQAIARDAHYARAHAGLADA